MRTHQTQRQIQTQLNHSWIKLVYGKHVNQYTFRRRGGGSDGKDFEYMYSQTWENI